MVSKAGVRVLAALAVLVVSGCSTAFKGEVLTGEIVADDWRMPIAPAYDAFFDDTLYSIQREGMVGAFQISTVSKTGGAVTEADINKMAEPFIRRRATLESMPMADGIAYRTVFSDTGVHWRAWYFGVDNTVVFVTYSAYERELNRAELDEIESMVARFRAT
ncbi:MAG: hypothetical protein AAGA11_14300 [Pseudomonadota bacterium]